MYTSTSWYKPGQTPGSVLGEVSSSMEECRAETVALYCKLTTCSSKHVERLLYPLVVSNPDILKIFNVCLHIEIRPADATLTPCFLCSTPIRKTLRTSSTSLSCSWLVLV